MSIVECIPEVSSRRKDQRNRTHVDRSLTCCSEESSEVLDYQNVVDGAKQHPRHLYFTDV